MTHNISNFELSDSWAAKLRHMQNEASRRIQLSVDYIRTAILHNLKGKEPFSTAITENVLEYSFKFT